MQRNFLNVLKHHLFFRCPGYAGKMYPKHVINILCKPAALNGSCLLTKLVPYSQQSCQQEEQHLAFISWAWACQQVCFTDAWGHFSISPPTFSCPFLFFLLAPHLLLPWANPSVPNYPQTHFNGKITFSLSTVILNIISLITYIVSSHYKSVFWGLGLHLTNCCLI